MRETRQTDDESTDDQSGFSRRGILGGLGAAAVAAGLPVAASTGGANSTDTQPSDVEILNFALTLEHLEYAFYRDSLQQFDERDFQRSELLEEFGFGMRFTARDYLGTIRDHEEAHVDFLTEAIENAGGEPAEEATEYNFGAPLGQDGLESVVDFATVAEVLEMTGVDAYAGAAPSISNPDFVPPALSIHSVEANHAAYLRNLNGNVPFPTAFNEAQSMDEVVNAVTPIIVEQ
jgi:rubrerythrin